VADACSALGVRAVLVQADMTDTSEARRAVREAREALGGLDLVIANAVCSFFFIWRVRDAGGVADGANLTGVGVVGMDAVQRLERLG
jgi:NAD(P)-dependent dehydrogenase (short-subunit alcohol dehydrogenase family)